MDTRKTRLHGTLFFCCGNEMEVLKEQCAVGIDEIISIVNQFEQPVTFGDGVPVFQEYIAENCSVPYTLPPAHVNKRAGAVAALGMKYFCRGQIRNRCRNTSRNICACPRRENEKRAD